MLTYALVMVQSYLATLEREEGQGMVEYGLILALIVVGVIAFLGPIGEAIAAAFESVSTALAG